MIILRQSVCNGKISSKEKNEQEKPEGAKKEIDWLSKRYTV